MNLRMQATRATFEGLPGCTVDVGSGALTIGFRVIRDHRAHGQNRANRRPSAQIMRAGRGALPLSRLNGATPTNAAICLRFKVPSSGSSASRVALTTAPTPGALRSTSDFSRHAGLARMEDASSLIQYRDLLLQAAHGRGDPAPNHTRSRALSGSLPPVIIPAAGGAGPVTPRVRGFPGQASPAVRA